VEKNGFTSPAVAGILGSGFVESRIHLDGQSVLSAEKVEENNDLASRYSGDRTRPAYVIVDPKTGEKLGERFVLEDSNFSAEYERMAAWLEEQYEPWAEKRAAEAAQKEQKTARR